PLLQPLGQLVAEPPVKTELPQKVAKHAVVETVITGRQIEAGRVNKAVVDSLSGGVVEGSVRRAPLSIEPGRRLSCVQMPENSLQLTMPDLGGELLGNQVDRGLIDDLIL